ncbi:MAG: LOW QUALITY PROTEIN: hypothetical protein BJ554DRAFT_7715, partial [Olpidium bornovanus]
RAATPTAAGTATPGPPGFAAAAAAAAVAATAATDLHREALAVLLRLLLGEGNGRLPPTVFLQKPPVLHRVRGADAVRRLVLEQPAQQVEPPRVEGREVGGEVLGLVLGEILLVAGQLRNALPDRLVGRAQEAEDLEQLVVVVRPGEERPAGDHLGQDAPAGPHVDVGGVGDGTEEHVGSAVPQGDHLVREGVDGYSERPGQAEIRELKLALGRDK